MAYYNPKYDLNGDGVLNGNEISLSLEDAVAGIGNIADLNGDGFISDSEYDARETAEELKDYDEKEWLLAQLQKQKNDLKLHEDEIILE